TRRVVSCAAAGMAAAAVTSAASTAMSFMSPSRSNRFEARVGAAYRGVNVFSGLRLGLFPRVEAVGIAAGRFHGVHRAVGELQQLVLFCGVLGKHADADAGADLELVRSEHERFGLRGED